MPLFITVVAPVQGQASTPMSQYEVLYLHWAAVTAIAIVIATIVFLVGAFFTASQLRHAAKARQLESALAVLKHIDSPDFRMARRLVFSPDLCTKLSDELARKPSMDQLDALFRALSSNAVDFKDFHSYIASLEHLAILVMNGLAPNEIVDMYFSRMLPQHWLALAPFVRYMRSYYKTDDFLQHFEMLTTLITADKLRPGMISTFETGRSRRLLLRRRRSFRRQITDYNIALLPDGSTEAALIELSERIRQVADSDIVLDSKLARPHLTLYLAGFPSRSEYEIKTKLENFCGRKPVVTARVINSVVVAPDGVVMLECAPSDELSTLHREVVETLNPLRGGTIGMVSLKRLFSLSAQHSDLVNAIGYPYGLELWAPHFTVAKVRVREEAKIKAVVGEFNHEVRFDKLALGISDF